MELATIKGDTALLIYHPAEGEASVGDQFSLLEMPNQDNGLIVQVVANELAEHEGLMQGVFQRLLESRLSEATVLMDGERGMGELSMLKIARTKIRKRVVDGSWREWDGYVPSRNVMIAKVNAQELLGNVLPLSPKVSLLPFVRHAGVSVALDGPRLGHVSVITGRKGTGKSHLGKHFSVALAALGVPVVVYDYNSEYTVLPNAQVLRWRDNFRLSLSECGFAVLRTVVSALSPLQPGSPSEAAFEARLPTLWKDRLDACSTRQSPFSIDLPYLLNVRWSDNTYVAAAIHERLEMIDEMGLFAYETSEGLALSKREGHGMQAAQRFADLYTGACQSKPLVFDRGETSPRLFGVLVRAVNQMLERLCRKGYGNDWGDKDMASTAFAPASLPYVIYDEAHLYLSEEAMLALLSRIRHVGISTIFLSNTPRRLPSDVFRQADNVFVLPTRHDDDLRAICEVALADADTIKMLVQRLPPRHALILGSLTDGYPLVVSIDALPDGVPATGVTRSAWDQFV